MSEGWGRGEHEETVSMLGQRGGKEKVLECQPQMLKVGARESMGGHGGMVVVWEKGTMGDTDVTISAQS